jgi:hypothetical protein
MSGVYQHSLNGRSNHDQSDGRSQIRDDSNCLQLIVACDGQAAAILLMDNGIAILDESRLSFYTRLQHDYLLTREAAFA